MVEIRIKPSPVRLNPLSRERSRFITTIRSVYKELHADHETGAADNK